MTNSEISRRSFLSVSAAAVATTLVPTVTIADDYNATAKQIEGPFYPKHKQADKNANVVQVDGQNGYADGEVLHITGRILDTNGKPVEGAIVDVWQADKNGRYLHEDAPESSPLDPNFQYWAQLKTGEDGSYNLKTIKTGKYPAMDDWLKPPHIHFKVARRPQSFVFKSN
ncbi:MAG: hypothetical protein JKY88_06540 [Pseudomonadales bacterium]|nr:hypothetical protein [Pseudomonadales bacterium]